METEHGVGRRSVRYDYKSSEGLDKGRNTGKGTRHKMVVKIGECDKAGVPRGVHPNSTDMYDDGTNY